MSKQSANGMTASVNQAANETAWTDSSVSNAVAETDVASPPRVGFLPLPPEIREMVYREMFHRPSPVEVRFVDKPVPDFLATCKLINREAFEILWGENPYAWNYPPPALLPNLLDRIVNTIRTLHVTVSWRASSPLFGDVIRRFGNHGKIRKIRDTLDITFSPYPYRPGPSPDIFTRLGWFIVGLSRFTNFKTVRIVFMYCKKPLLFSDGLCTQIAQIMYSRLGPSEPGDNEHGLVFHPRNYWKAQRPRETVDWMNHLDGIRLDWNR